MGIDSLVYELKTNEFMKVFMRIKICLILVIIHTFKVSDPSNKKVIVKIKDKVRGKIFSKFVGLK